MVWIIVALRLWKDKIPWHCHSKRLHGKVKEKFTLELATKVERGSTGIGLELLFL